MSQSGRKTLLEVKMAGDLLLCSASLLLASGLVSEPFWRKQAVVLRHPLAQVVLLAAVVCGWHLCLTLAGMYESFRLANWRQEAVSVGKASLSVTACSTAWLVLHVIAAGHRLVWSRAVTLELLLFAGISYALLLASRLGSRGLTAWVRMRGRNLRYALIIGTNRRAVQTAETLMERSTLGYQLLGFVDDVWIAEEAPDRYRSMLIATLAELPQLLRTVALDEVIITLPIASAYAAIQKIADECRQQGILVRCEVSLFDPFQRVPTVPNAPLQFAILHESSWNGAGVAIKRAIDFSAAFCALLALLPVLLSIAAAIKLTSRGPIFFVQERLGLGKRIFHVFKFRTMVADAERLLASLEHLNQTGGAAFKLTADPRITTVGRFLRKTSLDELPQLINVLLGDMSLVGPRPLPMRDYRGFSEDWHRRRFSVKPGITCLWQVMGRSSIGFERWMELDMRYIDSWSIWLDCKILLWTIPAVLRGSGAV